MNPLENFLQEKNAGFFGNIARGFRGTPELGGFGMELGRAAAGAAGTAAIAAAGVGIAKGISALRDAIGYNRDYKAMLSANPSLHKEDAGQVQMIYKSLRSLAPTIAKEPLLAASFVRNSLDLSPKEQPKIDLASMKTLAETQDRLGRGDGTILRGWTEGGRLQMPSALEIGKARQIQAQMVHQQAMNPMEQEQLRLQLSNLPAEQKMRELEHGWKGNQEARQDELHPELLREHVDKQQAAIERSREHGYKRLEQFKKMTGIRLQRTAKGFRPVPALTPTQLAFVQQYGIEP